MREARFPFRWDGARVTLTEVRAVGTIGITAGYDIVPAPGAPGKRAYDIMETGFHDHGLMVRVSGDSIALSPPLIITDSQIDEIFSDKLPKMLDAVA